jgi:hypothetical protein
MHNTQGTGQDSNHVPPEDYTDSYRRPPDLKECGLNSTGFEQDFFLFRILIIRQ